MNKSFLILLVLVIFLGAGFGGSFVGGVIYGQSLEDDTESELSPRLGAGQFQGGGAEAGPGQGGLGRRGQGGQGGQAGPGGRGSQDSNPSQEQADVASTTAEGPAAGPAGDSPRSERRAQARADGQTREEGREEGRNDASPVDRESGQDTAVETAQVATDTAPAGDDPGQEDAASLAASRSESRPAGGRGGATGVVQQWEGDRLTVTSPQGEVVVALLDATTIYRVGETTRESLTSGASVRVTGARDAGGVVNAQAIIIMPEGAENLFGSGRQSDRQGRGRP